MFRFYTQKDSELAGTSKNKNKDISWKYGWISSCGSWITKRITNIIVDDVAAGAPAGTNDDGGGGGGNVGMKCAIRSAF